MSAHQNTIPMALMQPAQGNVVENFYDKGEPVLPKQEGEFTFFMLQPIFTKDSEPFRETLGSNDPTRWDTDSFIPGREAPGPCVVIWNKVIRPGSAPAVLKPSTPPLIV